MVTSIVTTSYESLKRLSIPESSCFEALRHISAQSAINYELLTIVRAESRASYEPKSAGTDIGIQPAQAVGVLPQQGSGIYSFWSARRERSVLENRPWDNRISGRDRFGRTRKAWDVKIECGITVRNSIWAFIISHLGAGIPFFFYDLQNNGFLYDADGEETSGRYLVRFSDESFPQDYRRGSRFTFEFSVIEVE